MKLTELKGFVPALGTPLDKDGNLYKKSYKAQAEKMIEKGAVAVLSMGSMGQQAFIREETCVEVAETAVEAAAGRVPVLVGAMDNSIVRAKKRMASMEHLDLTAFVFTTPYYEVDSKDQVLTYFEELANSTSHGFILYDLPGVTNFKITYDMVQELEHRVKNLVGIKSADLQMHRKIRLNQDLSHIQTFYSGLDTFDIAYPWGIGCILDGMLPATPNNTEKMIRALDRGDREEAAKALSNIVELRDKFIGWDLWPAFSATMNLLGFEGFFAPDWATEVSDGTKEEIKEELKKIGEL